MSERPVLTDFLSNLPLRLLHLLTRPLSARARYTVNAWFGRRLLLNLPRISRRVDENLRLIFPQMPAAERARILRDYAGNAANTILELRHSAAMLTDRSRYDVEGEAGLAALDRARAEGRGALIVSGHFGQWEAIRAVLKARGMETGAIFRPHNNMFFNRDMVPHFEAFGKPIFPKGPQGMRALIRHVSQGGFAAVLLDQKTWDGEVLDFLGQPATTATGIAEMALRYDLPLVPAYGIRLPCHTRFRVVFEAPVSGDDARAVTQALNDSLAARVREAPAQWHWAHRRWDAVTREDLKARAEAAEVSAGTQPPV